MGKLRIALVAAFATVGLYACGGTVDGNFDEETATESEAINQYNGLLLSGETLYSGERMYSFIDPLVFLTMQGDCNLVLRSHGTVLWNSRTAGRGTNCRATMQGDGNFVVSNPNGPVWWSGSQGHPGAALWLSADGNGIRLYVKLNSYYKWIYPT
jgi:hypothetical protein